MQSPALLPRNVTPPAAEILVQNDTVKLALARSRPVDGGTKTAESGLDENESAERSLPRFGRSSEYVALMIAPLRPRPDESIALVPAPSSSFQKPSMPPRPGARVVSQTVADGTDGLSNASTPVTR